MSDWTKPTITLDPKDHDPSDSKAQNKWFFSFQISWITPITDPSLPTNRLFISLYPKFPFYMLDWALNLPLMPVLITLISKQFWSVALFLRGNYDGEVILVYCSSHYSVGVLWLSYNVRKLLSNLLPYLRRVSKNYWSRIYLCLTNNRCHILKSKIYTPEYKGGEGGVQ